MGNTNAAETKGFCSDVFNSVVSRIGHTLVKEAYAMEDDRTKVESILSYIKRKDNNFSLSDIKQIIETSIYGNKTLHYAAKKNMGVIVYNLIELGADINAIGFAGNRALHYAAENGRTAIVNDLIKAGADVELKNASEETALDLVNRDTHPEIVLALRTAALPPEEKSAVQKHTKFLESLSKLTT